LQRSGRAFNLSPRIITMVELRSWNRELWAVAGTLGTAGGLVGLLAAIDGRQIYDWKHVTIHSIVSIFSVLMKGLTLYAVAECVGQWNWIVLHRSKRKLLGFEHTDQAI
jgi:hypothetical protein